MCLLYLQPFLQCKGSKSVDDIAIPAVSKDSEKILSLSTDGGLLRFDELFKKAWEQSSESEESDDAEEGGLDLRLLIGMGPCVDETVWVLSFAEGSWNRRMSSIRHSIAFIGCNQNWIQQLYWGDAGFWFSDLISKEASIVFSDGFEHGQTPAAQDMALEEALGDLKAAVLSATEDLRKQAKHQEVWAVMEGVEGIASNFLNLVPDMALTFPFELDTFQKEQGRQWLQSMPLHWQPKWAFFHNLNDLLSLWEYIGMPWLFEICLLLAVCCSDLFLILWFSEKCDLMSFDDGSSAWFQGISISTV
jgi:hypothetical protein